MDSYDGLRVAELILETFAILNEVVNQIWRESVFFSSLGEGFGDSRHFLPLIALVSRVGTREEDDTGDTLQQVFPCLLLFMGEANGLGIISCTNVGKGS